VLNPWKLFAECRLNTVTIIYHTVKFMNGKITSKGRTLLYAMMRDQEGCQCQGLRTDDGATTIQSRANTQ